MKYNQRTADIDGIELGQAHGGGYTVLVPKLKYVMMARQTTYSNKKGSSKPLVTLGLFASLLLSPAAFSKTFYISDSGDSPDTDLGDGSCGICTLRAAIQEANVTPGADVIDLGVYDITLSRPGAHENSGATGDLDITDDLTIIGNKGATVRNIIDANYIDRVFHVAGGATVAISNVEIRDGWLFVDGNTPKNERTGGAGIYVENGNLSLDNVAITGNELAAFEATFITAGGGMYVGANAIVLVDNSTISQNKAPAGGGVTNLGSTTIQNSLVEANSAKGGWGGGLENLGGYLNIGNSTIRSNKAAQGGGVYSMEIGQNTGSVIISNVNVEQNDASLFGGGIYNLGPMAISNSSIGGNESVNDGGGIYNSSRGNMDIVNTTVSGNAGRSGGGIYNTREVSLTSSTVYNNQACLNCNINSSESAVGGNEIAIFNNSDGSSPGLTLTSTIIADGQFSQRLFDACSGAPGYELRIASGGHNLETGDSCGLVTTYPREDIIDVNIDDLLLGSLQLDTTNSMTTTPVHPLLPNSPAIDSGGDNCPLTDQRFLERSDGQCDIGAYEHEAITPLNPDLVDLKLSIKDTPDPARPNDQNSLLTYTFTVTNLYLKEANGISIDIQLPVSFNFANIKTATSGDLVSCDAAPNAQNLIECGISSLEPLGRVDISVSGVPTVMDTITASGEIIFANEAFRENNKDSEDTEISNSAPGGVSNFGGSSSGGGSLHPLFLLLMGGLFLSRRNRR